LIVTHAVIEVVQSTFPSVFLGKQKNNKSTRAIAGACAIALTVL